MYGKALKYIAKAVCCLWFFLLVVPVHSETDTYLGIPSASSNQVDQRSPNNCQNECRDENDNPMWQLLRALQSDVTTCPPTIGDTDELDWSAVEWTLNTPSSNGTGYGRDIAESMGLLDKITVEIKQCGEDETTRTQQCTGLTLNQSRCQFRLRDQMNTYVKLNLFGSCVQQLSVAIQNNNTATCDNLKVRITGISPSGLRWLKSLLKKKYSDTCVFHTKKDWVDRHQKRPETDIETDSKFFTNYTVVSLYHSYQYDLGRLLATENSNDIECTPRRPSPEEAVDSALEELSNIADDEDFVCFVSLYMHHLDENEDIQVTCMSPKNGASGGSSKGEDGSIDDYVIIITVLITAAVSSAVIIWMICTCDKKIKSLASLVKAIPPSLASAMKGEPEGFDNHYFHSDEGCEKTEYAHEIHDILRDPEDNLPTNDENEDENFREEEQMFCYPPTPLLNHNKDLLYITIQPMVKVQDDSGIDVGFESSDYTGMTPMTRSAGSSPRYSFTEVGVNERNQSTSCDSGISSLRSTSVDDSGFSSEKLGFTTDKMGFSTEKMGFSTDKMGFSTEKMGFHTEKLPVVNTICGTYCSKADFKVPPSGACNANYFNKADVASGNYWGKAQVNADSGNYWNKLKVGNYWAKA